MGRTPIYGRKENETTLEALKEVELFCISFESKIGQGRNYNF
jgi:hypothetical protein